MYKVNLQLYFSNVISELLFIVSLTNNKHYYYYYYYYKWTQLNLLDDKKILGRNKEDQEEVNQEEKEATFQ